MDTQPKLKRLTDTEAQHVGLPGANLQNKSLLQPLGFMDALKNCGIHSVMDFRWSIEAQLAGN